MSMQNPCLDNDEHEKLVLMNRFNQINLAISSDCDETDNSETEMYGKSFVSKPDSLQLNNGDDRFHKRAHYCKDREPSYETNEITDTVGDTNYKTHSLDSSPLTLPYCNCDYISNIQPLDTSQISLLAVESSIFSRISRRRAASFDHDNTLDTPTGNVNHSGNVPSWRNRNFVSGAVSTITSAVAGFLKPTNSSNALKEEETLYDVAEHVTKVDDLWKEFQSQLGQSHVVTNHATLFVFDKFVREKMDGVPLQNGISLDYQKMQAGAVRRYSDSITTVQTNCSRKKIFSLSSGTDEKQKQEQQLQQKQHIMLHQTARQHSPIWPILNIPNPRASFLKQQSDSSHDNQGLTRLFRSSPDYDTTNTFEDIYIPE